MRKSGKYVPIWTTYLFSTALLDLRGKFTCLISTTNSSIYMWNKILIRDGMAPVKYGPYSIKAVTKFKKLFNLLTQQWH